MDQVIRNLRTLHKVLYPRINIDILYVQKKVGKSGLASIKDCAYESIQGFGDYIKRAKKD